MKSHYIPAIVLGVAAVGYVVGAPAAGFLLLGAALAYDHFKTPKS